MKKLILFFILLILLSSYVYSQCDTTGLQSSVISHYKLEETGLDYADEKGGNDLDSGTIPDRVVGIIDFGQDFEYSNADYLYVATNSFEDTTSTVSWWFNVESYASGTNKHLIDYFFYGNPQYYGWNCYIKNTDAKLYCFLGDGTSSLEIINSQSAFSTSGWHYGVLKIGTTIELFIDGVSEANSTSTNMAFDTNMHQFGLSNIYWEGSYLNRYFDGIVDEVTIFDSEISNDCVDHLYNSGSARSYPFAGTDTTPPNITVVYPQNATHINDFNGSIILTINEAGNCSINDSSFEKVVDQSQTFRWQNSTKPNGNYSFLATCNDTALNQRNASFYFVFDSLTPTLNIHSPLNNSLQTGDFYVNVSYYDKYLLYTNTTIKNASGSVVYNNYSGILSGIDISYNVTDLFSITGLPFGFYTLYAEGFDTHTGEEFSETTTITESEDTTVKKKSYSFINGNINFEFDKDITVTEIYDFDRIKFQICTMDGSNLGKRKFTIYNDDDLIYLPLSPWTGHFIFSDRYWWDFEPMILDKIKEKDKKYDFETTIDAPCITTESLGSLNQINKTHVFEIRKAASIEHIDVEIDEVIFDSSTYTQILDATFNLSEPKTITIFGAMQLQKTSGPQRIQMDMRLNVSNVTLFDQTIRSLSGTADRGVATVPITQFNASTFNTFTVEVKDDGTAGGINISSLEFHIFTNTTNDNEPVIIKRDTVHTTFDSNTFTNIGRVDINKLSLDINFSTLLDISHKLTASRNSITVDCYWQNNATMEVTPTYTRWLQTSGTTGSSGMNYIDQIKTAGPQTWDLFCKHDSGVATTITNNVTVMLIDLTEPDADIIGNFQANASNIAGISGPNNLILQHNNYTVLDGNQIEVFVTAIIQSNTGAQTGSISPYFFFNTTQIPNEFCDEDYRRALFSDSDIGTVKAYYNCHNISEFINPGEGLDFNIYMDVDNAESLTVLEVSMSGVETVGEEANLINSPPIVLIDNPENNSVVSDNITISWTTSDADGDSWLTNITLSNVNITYDVATNLPYWITDYSFDTNLLNDSTYDLIVTSQENETTERLIGSHTHVLTIRNIIPASDCCNCSTIEKYINDSRDEILNEIEVTTMYIPIIIGLVAVLFFLLWFSMQFEFLQITVKDDIKIPPIKYTIWLVCLYLLLPIINVGIVIDQRNNAGLASTLGVVYKAILYVDIFITALWLISVIFFSLRFMTMKGEELV